MKIKTIIETVIVASVIGVCVGLACNAAHHKEPVYGEIEADHNIVSSTVPGRIVSVDVSLGQNVHKGQVLYTLKNENINDLIAVATEQLKSASTINSDIKEGYDPGIISTLRDQYSKTGSELQLAEKTYKGASALYQSGSVSSNQLDQLDTILKIATKNNAIARTALNRSEDGYRKGAVVSAESNKEISRIMLSQLERLKSDLVVRAQVDGRVDNIYLGQGDLAPIGLPVMTIEKNNKHMTFDVKEDALSKFSVGSQFMASTPALDNKLIKFEVTALHKEQNFADWNAGDDLILKTFSVRAKPVGGLSNKLVDGMTVLVQ